MCRSEVATGIFESVSFRQSRGDWWVQLLLLMPDHLHMLVSFSFDKDMKSVISKWKEFVAKKCGVHWQSNFFDHRLRKEESLRGKADYILNNPVRRGLIARVEDWPYVWMPDGRIEPQEVGLDRRASRGAARPTTAARPAVAPYQRHG